MVFPVSEVHLDMSGSMQERVLAKESHGRTAHRLYLQDKDGPPGSIGQGLRVRHLLSRSSRSIGQFMQVLNLSFFSFFFLLLSTFILVEIFGPCYK